MNILEGIEKTLLAVLTQARKDNVIGPVNTKIKTFGNKEGLQSQMEKVAKEVCEALNYVYSDMFVVYDDDNFTSIRITAYNKDNIIKYIDDLHKKENVRQNPRQMLNAFNKALTIADHFNNMFGEGIHNKSKELNEINDIYDLMKDVYKN